MRSARRRGSPSDGPPGRPLHRSRDVASVASARAPIPYPPESRLLAQLEKPVLASVHGGGGVVVLRRDDTSYAAATLAGLALELERHHVPVCIDARHDPPLGALFTPSRL